MKINRLPSWLCFFLFLIVFAVAFFLILFIVDKNPAKDLRMSFVKIGILATVVSLLYTIFFSSDRKMVDE